MTTLNRDHLSRMVWRKAHPIPNIDSHIWRKDKCGSLIKFGDYGDRDSPYGWEIHHINPTSNGGSDDIYNLMPLHWANNNATSDSTRLVCEVRN
jgi:hypothetical protein